MNREWIHPPMAFLGALAGGLAVAAVFFYGTDYEHEHVCAARADFAEAYMAAERAGDDIALFETMVRKTIRRESNHLTKAQIKNEGWNAFQEYDLLKLTAPTFVNAIAPETLRNKVYGECLAEVNQ